MPMLLAHPITVALSVCTDAPEPSAGSALTPSSGALSSGAASLFLQSPPELLISVCGAQGVLGQPGRMVPGSLAPPPTPGPAPERLPAQSPLASYLPVGPASEPLDEAGGLSTGQEWGLPGGTAARLQPRPVQQLTRPHTSAAMHSESSDFK